MDLAYKGYPEKARLPYFVVVNVVIKGQNKNGHPTNEEAEVLNAVEDQITAALFDVERTPFLGRMTTRGLREIMYHVRDPEQTHAILTRLAARPQPREWEFTVVREPDPTWKGVEQLFDDSPCL